MSGDGGADARPWVPFGDLPNQLLHPDTVEAMLRRWKERHPEQFGALLAEVLTGARLTKARERKR